MRLKKVKATVTGEVTTHMREGETEEEAKARVVGAVWKAETSINEDTSVRAHFHCSEPKVTGVSDR
jgi:hypothetical protein